jgi:diguanylate cyclase (GGDEF)-like protein/PAS domain S-box-containing protein
MVKDLQERNANTRFDTLLAEAAFQIKVRFLGYEQVLKGAHGYLLASGFVSREGWRTYMKTLRLADSYPGILGVGFAEHLLPTELPAHIAAVRAQGFPEYNVWPEEPLRDRYTTIIYLEPFAGRNMRAFGYDMYSDPVRRLAMSQARDSGKAALTGKVKLVQETSEDVQAGVLMYLPYYGRAKLPQTLEERQSSLIGYVYAPFRMNDFIRTILQSELQSVDLKIFDGNAITENSLLFDSNGSGTAQVFPRFRGTRVISAYGQTWTIEASSRPLFEEAVSSNEAVLVLLSGILVSILSAVVSFVLSANKEKAVALGQVNNKLLSAIEEQRAATLELSNSKLRIERIMGSITDAFFALDREWRFTLLNKEAENLLRRTRGDLLGREIWKEFPEAVGSAFDREFHRALAENCTVSFQDFYVPLDAWFEVHAYPSEEGLAVYFRNITERKQAEVARREADARIRQQASLLDHATDAIIVRGLDHRIQFWNKGAQRLYEWASEEVVGNSIDNVLYDDPEAFYEAAHLALHAGEWRGEITQRRKGGGILTAEGRWTLVRNDAGQPQSVLEINTDITQRKVAESEIQHLAFYDSLTRLPNRQLLLDRLKQVLAVSARSRQTGALLFIDLDNFKLLNDTLGHDIGDLLLQQIAPRLVSCVREHDTVARIGGDEFVIILAPDFSEYPAEAVARISAVCERILAAFSPPFNLGAYQQHTTPSIGVTLFGNRSTTTDELLKQADLAMYEAKASGRNAICFFDPAMQAVMNARVALESDLHKSWERNEFVLHYQPQVSSHGVTGAEALLRWQHPRRGLLSPAEFIPQAEETGLILPIGLWVLQTACAQLAAWSGRPETAGLDLAVNVSPRQFRHPAFIEQVRSALHQTGANPQKLKLELTEGLLVRNMDETIAKMTALKAEGVGFALDDFGTGYSSLYYLKRLPLDWIKIDQSFIKDVLTRPHDAIIVRTIVALAQNMGLAVIAEGVETQAQRDFLAQNGCGAYQGYLYSQPLALDRFEEFMREKRGGGQC